MSAHRIQYSATTIVHDLVAGLVVFLVALPLCLGIALASGADLFSGLLSGIVGGLVVAAISGSHTSVSGPAAGLTAIVAAQIVLLDSFEAFLLAVCVAGVIQIGFGIARGGALSAFFPFSVIKGLLVAIGVILILKQIPHVFGHDSDPEGEMSFQQPDHQNTFSELLTTFAGDIHIGAMVIGLLSLALLLIWDRIPTLKKSIVASLETLLNLEAVDKLDTEKRKSPSSRELIAQGCGNLICGLIGGLPVTSVVVRGSVNVHAGGKTKLSAIVHGALLLLSVAVLPQYMNMIPLSALAAILLVTGLKLASPKVFQQVWSEGRYQFIPFIATVVAIVMTDLLIGLAIAVLFILNSNLRRPIRRIVEHHLAGDITHVELANQVSFLNRAAIERILNEAKSGTRLLIDATESDYIDPDVLSMIREFKTSVAPTRDILVNLTGFRKKYELNDSVQFADYSTRELQERVNPEQVIEILRNGNQRFVSGSRLNRDLGRQVYATASGQNPLAAILSCIDSRVPTELVFDLGVGDIFSVRVAGNVVGTKSLGSLEYAVGVANVKLVLVLGHTRCGAVTSAVNLVTTGQNAMSATGCQHLQAIVDEIAPSIDVTSSSLNGRTDEQVERLVDDVAIRNVLHTVDEISRRSDLIRNAVAEGRVAVQGAIYDVKSGRIEFLNADGSPNEFVRQTEAL